MDTTFNIFDFLTPKGMTQFIDERATVRQALEKFDAHKFSVVPVIDKDGNYINTIAEGDLLRFIKNECHFDIKVAETKTIDTIERYRSYEALSINCSEKEVLKLSLSQNFIPLIDDRNKFIGIVKRSDIISFLLKKYRLNYI